VRHALEEAHSRFFDRDTITPRLDGATGALELIAGHRVTASLSCAVCGEQDLDLQVLVGAEAIEQGEGSVGSREGGV
jgi:hypothetical protein